MTIFDYKDLPVSEGVRLAAQAISARFTSFSISLHPLDFITYLNNIGKIHTDSPSVPVYLAIGTHLKVLKVRIDWDNSCSKGVGNIYSEVLESTIKVAEIVLSE